VAGPERQAQVLARIAPAMDELLDRAKAQGALRPDAVAVDIPMIQLMVASITDRTGRPDLWRRYLRLLLDGLQARPGATDLPGIAIEGTEFMDAVDEAADREAHERRPR
jgi:hypothetical protein